MADILILKRRLSVGTVDSFQGQERGISAITLTRSNPQGEIGFLPDIRRMNVGMTRARRKLLLVGDSSTLCRDPFFEELLAYVKGVGGYRTPRGPKGAVPASMQSISDRVFTYSAGLEAG
jgi:superfamily I DNA and/or RNA helicase